MDSKTKAALCFGTAAAALWCLGKSDKVVVLDPAVEVVASEPAAAPVSKRDWGTSLGSAEVEQKLTGQPIFLALETDGCVPCERVKKNCYQSGSMAKRLLTEFIPVRLHIPMYKKTPEAMKYGTTKYGYPRAVIIRPDGSWVAWLPSSDPVEFAKQVDSRK